MNEIYAETDGIEAVELARELAVNADGTFFEGVPVPPLKGLEVALPINDDSTDNIIGYVVANRAKLVSVLNAAGLRKMANALPAVKAGFMAGESLEASLSNRTIWNDKESIDQVFDSGEKFFLSLKDGKYDTAWNLLSEKSHETIINDVYNAYMSFNYNIKKQDVTHDFSIRGTKFLNYWNSFRSNFNTAVILDQSRWEIGSIEKDKAEIMIRYYKSERPTKLKLLKENNAWKVGLVETFWASRGREAIQSIFQ